MRGVCDLSGLLWNRQNHKFDYRRHVLNATSWHYKKGTSCASPSSTDLLHWELPLELVLPDSCCASSSIFSRSPSWMDVGICSWLPWWLIHCEPAPLKWSSTQEPEKNQHAIVKNLGSDTLSLAYIGWDWAVEHYDAFVFGLRTVW